MATKKKATEPVEEREVGSVVALTEEEQEAMTAAEQEVVRAKIVLADADVILSGAERSKNEARERMLKANETYTNMVISVAKKHGINTEDKTQKWSFDTSKLQFTRQA